MQGKSVSVHKYILLSIYKPYVLLFGSSIVIARSWSLAAVAWLSPFLSLVAAWRMAATSVFALKIKPTSRS